LLGHPSLVSSFQDLCPEARGTKETYKALFLFIVRWCYPTGNFCKFIEYSFDGFVQISEGIRTYKTRLPLPSLFHSFSESWYIPKQPPYRDFLPSSVFLSVIARGAENASHSVQIPLFSPFLPCSFSCLENTSPPLLRLPSPTVSSNFWENRLFDRGFLFPPSFFPPFAQYPLCPAQVSKSSLSFSAFLRFAARRLPAKSDAFWCFSSLSYEYRGIRSRNGLIEGHPSLFLFWRFPFLFCFRGGQR